MAEPEFTKGDTVKLKSGGPLMVVEDVDGNKVSCLWFERSKKGDPRSWKFDSNVLVKAEPGKAVAVW